MSILLTDLHLSERTEDVVFEILEWAYERDELNVLILGDFWDRPYADGSIDVRLMNKCLLFFANQTKSTVAIPGNHDYFGPNEQDHALVCFKTVMTVVSSPTKIGTALFLPYRSDGYKRSYLQRMKREGVKTVFSHNDIRAVSHRRGRLSLDGIDMDAFEGLTVFNGHYHYPSSTGDVHCIGTHYAVHTNENHDQKYVWIVKDCSFEKIPVRFGARTFVYSPDHLQRMIKYKWSGCIMPVEGDTIIIENGKEVDIGIEGVTVLTRHVENNVNVDLQLGDYNTMISHISNAIYSDEVDVANSTAILKVINYVPPADQQTSVTRLHIERIVMVDFCGVKQYELNVQSGTTLVHGANGSGKTMRFVSAAIYCLSGIIDERFSGKPVYADLGRNAQVTVSGKINEKSFTVNRSYNSKTNIVFEYDGTQVVFPTIKRIQKEINYILCNIDRQQPGSPGHEMYKFLRKTVFFTQKLNTNMFSFTKFDDIIKKLKREERGLRLVSSPIDDLREQLFLAKQRHHIESSGLRAFEQYRSSELMALHARRATLDKPVYPSLTPGASQQKITIEALIAENNIEHSLDYYCGLREFVEPLKFIDIKQQYQNAKCLVKLMEFENTSCPVCDTKFEDTTALKERQVQNTKRLKSLRNEYRKWKIEHNIWSLAQAFAMGVGSDEYIAYTREFASIELKIEQLTNTQEGVSWVPEKNFLEILKLEEEILIEEELEVKLRDTSRAITCLEVLTEWFNKNQTLDFHNHLSGGEYEEKVIEMFFKYRNYVKHWELWSCNLLVMDEAGPHMDATRFQRLVESIQEESAYIISHKTINGFRTIMI